MDLYSAMQFLATAACIAAFFALALPSLGRSQATRPDESVEDTRGLARACWLIAAACALLAFALGCHLFGFKAVLDCLQEGTVRLAPEIIVLCLVVGGFIAYRTTIAAGEPQRGQQLKKSRSSNAGATGVGDACVLILHKRTRKVLWRMARASLEGADLYRANLQSAELRGADLTGADLRGADLRGADLSRPGHALVNELADLGLTWLAAMSLPLALFRSLLAPGDLRAMVIIICAASFAQVFQTSLKWNEPLRSPRNMRGAILEEADLRGAALAGTKLTGARYDARTRWPKGFDPTRHGATEHPPLPNL
jgi:hypothetical protein